MTIESKNMLADFVHEQWSGWMRYLFEKGTFNDDGTWTMPKWAVDRWVRQMNTPFSQLSKEEQNSDHEEVEKFIQVYETNVLDPIRE